MSFPSEAWGHQYLRKRRGRQSRHRLADHPEVLAGCGDRDPLSRPTAAARLLADGGRPQTPLDLLVDTQPGHHRQGGSSQRPGRSRLVDLAASSCCRPGAPIASRGLDRRTRRRTRPGRGRRRGGGGAPDPRQPSRRAARPRRVSTPDPAEALCASAILGERRSARSDRGRWRSRGRSPASDACRAHTVLHPRPPSSICPSAIFGDGSVQPTRNAAALAVLARRSAEDGGVARSTCLDCRGGGAASSWLRACGRPGSAAHCRRRCSTRSSALAETTWSPIAGERLLGSSWNCPSRPPARFSTPSRSSPRGAPMRICRPRPGLIDRVQQEV